MATIALLTLLAVAGVGSGISSASKAKSATKRAAGLQADKFRAANQVTDEPKPVADLTAEEQLKKARGGARLSLISTGPQGILGDAPVGRRKLLSR